MRGDLTLLGQSVKVAQRHLADAKSALFAVDCECNEYRRRLGIKGKLGGVLETLLHNDCSRLVSHTSLVDPARYFLHQDMDRYLDVYLLAIFTMVHNCTTIFILRRSALSRDIVLRFVRTFRPS